MEIASAFGFSTHIPSLTYADNPGQIILEDVRIMELALAADRLILPMMEASILHVGAHGRPDRVPEMTPTGLVFKWSVLEQREAWPVTATRL
jgi:hypothetical protein